MQRHKLMSTTRWCLVVIIFFSIEFALVFKARIDTLNVLLQHHWQIADLYSLAAEPFTSWIYIHSQPPLLNIIVALISSISDQVYLYFIIINCLCAAFISCTILYIVNTYNDRYKLFGYILAVVYLIAPSTLLNSAYPYYPSLTSAGYAGIALAFFTAAQKERLSIILLCSSIVFLTLLRSSFPPVTAFAIICLYFIFVANRTNWKRNFLLISFISLIPITSIYIKNYVMYDFWGSSSFAPINIAKGFGVPIELNYFPTPQQIQQERPNINCDYGYKSIDTEIFKRDGNPNYNSCYFLAFAQNQKHKAWENYNFNKHTYRVIAHVGKYFSLPDGYEYLSNREKIESYRNIFNSIFIPISIRHGYDIRINILLIIMVMPIGLWMYRDKRMIILYSIFMIHFVTHVMTDGYESDRFVFDIEFLFYIFFAFLCKSYLVKKTYFK